MEHSLLQVLGAEILKLFLELVLTTSIVIGPICSFFIILLAKSSRWRVIGVGILVIAAGAATIELKTYKRRPKTKVEARGYMIAEILQPADQSQRLSRLAP